MNVDGVRGSFGPHRIAYKFFKGQDPAEFFVCHKCDNPPCCNPYHLFIGTPQDNTADMVKKGRGLKGEINHKSKLTTTQVLEIRRRDAEQAEKKENRVKLWEQLSSEYGVSPSNIERIANGHTWRHLVPSYEPGQRRAVIPHTHGKTRCFPLSRQANPRSYTGNPQGLKRSVSYYLKTRSKVNFSRKVWR